MLYKFAEVLMLARRKWLVIPKKKIQHVYSMYVYPYAKATSPSFINSVIASQQFLFYHEHDATPFAFRMKCLWRSIRFIRRQKTAIVQSSIRRMSHDLLQQKAGYSTFPLHRGKPHFSVDFDVYFHDSLHPIFFHFHCKK